MAETAQVSQISKRLSQKKQLRQPIEPVWRDCFAVSYPMRGNGFAGQNYDAVQNQSKISNILDSVTTDAVKTLGSTIMSGLTPANNRWFQLDITGKEGNEERKWLDDAAQVLFENIHSANFDAEAFESIIDCVCAGWFCLFIDEDKELGGLRFEQWPLGGVYVSASKPGGAIDTVYREYSLSAQQIVNQFGDKVSAKTAKLAKDTPDALVQLVRVIEPRQGVKTGRLAINLPFASTTVEVEAGNTLLESGYHEFPIACPRWFKIPDSHYAVGPLSEALPDSNMLQKLKAMHLASADMAIAGMWIAEDDGVLNPRTMKVGARKIIVANSVDSVKPLNSPGNWQLAQEEIKNTQAAIRKIMMADVLQPQDGPAMTATEVHVRVNLVRQMLGPVYGRFQSEYLQPLINRCFGLAYRAGVFTEPPESLKGKPFTIKYISPLARAQKLEDATAVERMIAVTGQLMTLDPEVADEFDAKEALRILREAYGAPPSLHRDAADVEEIRSARQQQQEQQQQQMMIADMASKAAPEAIKQMAGAGQ